MPLGQKSFYDLSFRERFLNAARANIAPVKTKVTSHAYLLVVLASSFMTATRFSGMKAALNTISANGRIRGLVCLSPAVLANVWTMK